MNAQVEKRDTAGTPRVADAGGRQAGVQTVQGQARLWQHPGGVVPVTPGLVALDQRRLHAQRPEKPMTQRSSDLQMKVAALESFNRSVSHDLRGPLAGMAGLSGFASQALDEGDVESAKRMITAIGAQAESSLNLVNALLALAHAGDADMVREPVDTAALVRNTVEQMQSLDPHGPLLPVKIGTMPVVEADPELLRQVFVNLIGNAVKFCGASASALVEVGATRVEGDHWVLYVRDNGVGFDPTKASELFVPFKRLHAGSYQGHGVGLSIVKCIIERHGGAVWAHSTPRGATFSFTLPTAEGVN